MKAFTKWILWWIMVKNETAFGDIFVKKSKNNHGRVGLSS